MPWMMSWIAVDEPEHLQDLPKMGEEQRRAGDRDHAADAAADRGAAEHRGGDRRQQIGVADAAASDCG